MYRNIHESVGADAVKMLIESYFHNKSNVVFDYRDIRPKGSLLVTSGGKAPGPQPLKDCIHNIRKVLDNAIESRGRGTSLTTLETHDIICFIAYSVLSGGIRRAAIISLFSIDDNDMMNCKNRSILETEPQRMLANNSVVLVRHKITKKDFYNVWERVKQSGCGEPGIYLTNDKNIIPNPCVEATMPPNTFCNLTTINVSDVKDQKDLNARTKSASFIGTLQAGYTDFHYLRSIWKKNTDKQALLGVSMTGIGSGAVLDLDLKEAANVAVEENKRVAKLIGINPAYRVTLVKPEGTSSCVAGSASGIHAWHAPYFIRRIRLGKDEVLYSYLKSKIPHLIEDEYFNPNKQAVISIPVKAPEGSILRTEKPLKLLGRVKRFHDEWIRPGHIKGINTYNVSVTVSIKDDEWDEVGKWMWENKESYNGISVLNYDGGTYIQAPFKECTKDEYYSLLDHVKSIDLSEIVEEQDTTNLKGEVACGGAGCEIQNI